MRPLTLSLATVAFAACSSPDPATTGPGGDAQLEGSPAVQPIEASTLAGETPSPFASLMGSWVVPASTVDPRAWEAGDRVEALNELLDLVLDLDAEEFSLRSASQPEVLRTAGTIRYAALDDGVTAVLSTGGTSWAELTFDLEGTTLTAQGPGELWNTWVLQSPGPEWEGRRQAEVAGAIAALDQVLDASWLPGRWQIDLELVDVDAVLAEHPEDTETWRTLLYLARLEFEPTTLQVGVVVEDRIATPEADYRTAIADGGGLTMQIFYEDGETRRFEAQRSGEHLVLSGDPALGFSWVRISPDDYGAVERQTRTELEKRLAAPPPPIPDEPESAKPISVLKQILEDRLETSPPDLPELYADDAEPVDKSFLTGTWKLDADAIPWTEFLAGVPTKRWPGIKEFLATKRLHWSASGRFEQRSGDDPNAVKRGWYALAPTTSPVTWMALGTGGEADGEMRCETRGVVRVGSGLLLQEGQERWLLWIRE